MVLPCCVPDRTAPTSTTGPRAVSVSCTSGTSMPASRAICMAANSTLHMSHQVAFPIELGDPASILVIDQRLRPGTAQAAAMKKERLEALVYLPACLDVFGNFLQVDQVSRMGASALALAYRGSQR